jgi:multidrug efflux pump
VLGTVPLAIATGASANSRHSIGTGVIGGTLAATVVAIFFIPMFYWLLETVSAKLFGGAKSESNATADRTLMSTEAAGAETPPAPAPREGG